MSVFFNAYFIKTQEPESKLKERFWRVDIFPESKWAVCNFGDDYEDGMFEPGTYFTQEISEQFGEAIFIGVDTRNDQLDYEHSKAGIILRKLCWCTDGCQSTWGWVEGEKEAWEDAAIFSEENFARAREMVKYGEHLELLPEEEFLAKEKELRSIWDNRQYILGDTWPLGDASFNGAIEEYFGLKVPPRF
ncbi:hypothetical protein V2H45_12620 [Tumidithrix elongata RA019]|uniref:Uncharacterized protein n=1 Tax=Tumidithrix elongata BACA0141 TaxID=2716417 RepID=A0AAW9Q311_9CYAN|nr:hypothetical protein [Tumidithrix elongata RA019]